MRCAVAIRRTAFVCALFVALASARAEDQTPKIEQSTRGNFTNITVTGNGTFDDVMRSVKLLTLVPASQDAAVIEELTRKKNTNPPPYLIELARRLLSTDKAEASYYVHLADTRTRYDAFRCKDKSATAGYGMMLQQLRPQLEPWLKYANETPNASPGAYKTLHARDEVLASEASPWWICSHGMQAVMAAMSNRTLKSEDWLKPESEWPSIQATLREFVAKPREPKPAKQ
jgi:hypothetical protein